MGGMPWAWNQVETGSASMPGGEILAPLPVETRAHCRLTHAHALTFDHLLRLDTLDLSSVQSTVTHLQHELLAPLVEQIALLTQEAISRRRLGLHPLANLLRERLELAETLLGRTGDVGHDQDQVDESAQCG